MAQKKTTKKKATPKRKSAPKQAKAATPKPGETIERVYKGKKITVQVTDEGYRHAGKTYSSLTAVALHVTGYKAVSGPRFFGLVAAPKTKGG